MTVVTQQEGFTIFYVWSLLIFPPGDPISSQSSQMLGGLKTLNCSLV